MSVVIVDYGLSNLGSIRRSLEECGATVRVSDDPSALRSASRVVLPGVGSFADGMVNLRKGGWVTALQEAAKEDKIPLLGICLGMQLLADRGHEGGDIPGLGLLPGEVRRLEPHSPAEKIPHVGWNEIYPSGDVGSVQWHPGRVRFLFRTQLSPRSEIQRPCHCHHSILRKIRIRGWNGKCIRGAVPSGKKRAVGLSCFG